MMTIPAIMYPVLAFLFAVIVGRIGTIIMDYFRKYELEDSNSELPYEHLTHEAMLKHS